MASDGMIYTTKYSDANQRNVGIEASAWRVITGCYTMGLIGGKWEEYCQAFVREQRESQLI